MNNQKSNDLDVPEFMRGRPDHPLPPEERPLPEVEAPQPEAEEDLPPAEFEAVAEEELPRTKKGILNRLRIPIGCFALILAAIACYHFVGKPVLGGKTARSQQQTATATPLNAAVETGAAQTSTALAWTPTPKPPTSSFRGEYITRMEGAKQLATNLGINPADLPDPRGHFEDEGLSNENQKILEELRRRGFLPEDIKDIWPDPNNLHRYYPEENLTRTVGVFWEMLKEHGPQWRPNLETPCENTFVDVKDNDCHWIEAWANEFYDVGYRAKLFEPDGFWTLEQFKQLLEKKGK